MGRTDPSDVSIDTLDNAEVIASSHTIIGSTYTCHKFDSHELLHMVISVPYEDNESWFNALESLDNYNKRNKPLNTDGVDVIINESTNKYIKPDFYIGECQS